MARDETARDSEPETPLLGRLSRCGPAGRRATTVAGAEAVGDDTTRVPADVTPEQSTGDDVPVAPEVSDGY